MYVKIIIFPDLQRRFLNCSTFEIKNPLNLGVLCWTEIYLNNLQVSDVAGCSWCPNVVAYLVFWQHSKTMLIDYINKNMFRHSKNNLQKSIKPCIFSIWGRKKKTTFKDLLWFNGLLPVPIMQWDIIAQLKTS